MSEVITGVPLGEKRRQSRTHSKPDVMPASSWILFVPG
jgi:hypothetical protein